MGRSTTLELDVLCEKDVTDSGTKNGDEHTVWSPGGLSGRAAPSSPGSSISSWTPHPLPCLGGVTAWFRIQGLGFGVWGLGLRV